MTSDQNTNRNCENAWIKLDEIFNIWSNIGEDDEVEVRSPANQKEIKKSRKLIQEAKSLGCTDAEVNDRIEELEGVIDSIDEIMPRYKSKVIQAILFSLVFIVGLWLYFSQEVYKAPDFQYEETWFVNEKGGYLFWNAFLDEKEQGQESRKIYVKKGTKLTPIATIGNWVQVETPDGQRGLIDPLILSGSNYTVSNNPQTKLFKKTGEDPIDTIGEGISGTIVDRYTNKDRTIWVRYLKIKFDDGKIRWAYKNDFIQPMTNSLPEIEQLFAHITNLEKVETHFLGKSIDDFEQQYGPALSKLTVGGNSQAYFRHLIIADGKTHYDGIILNLDDGNSIQEIKYTSKGKKRTYEFFPLVSTFRNAEIQNVERISLYEKNTFEWDWWENFQQKNWFTRIIGWIFWLVRFIIVIILVFSIPKIVIQPLLQVFMFNPRFSNATVTLLIFALLFLVYYPFFILMILLMDQWLLPIIACLIFYGFWSFKYSMNIEYNRCPDCKVMYSALDKGSTFTGRKTTKMRGTYDVYKGTTETSTTITKNYERRNKVTTKHVDSYLDHRMCKLCGYKWDVDRDVTKEKTKHY